ncbi:MAG TPA: phosphoesterase [Prolixibacteraceae bacterium]|nr:phosphoesterase [Prolixibacteraceae bacterium]
MESKSQHMIDFIGDIHGYADQLTQLLEKMGYSSKFGIYSHPKRKVIFVGDYIDRGPKIRETLMIVRNMVENGEAIALMGNHEYNALCFHYEEREGGHLRKHLIKNILQHIATLEQFQNRQEEYEDYLEWFKTLPLYYESDSFRAVHACWDKDNIAYLRKVLKNDRLNEHTLHESVKMGAELYRTLDETLKGKEVSMPKGVLFLDKDDNQRSELRIKWWNDPIKTSYREISILPNENLPEEPVNTSRLHSLNYYSDKEKPVFFGHYWLQGLPQLFRENICCLDYSVAKDGYLAAYRFDGEKKLSNDKFVFVKTVSSFGKVL